VTKPRSFRFVGSGGPPPVLPYGVARVDASGDAVLVRVDPKHRDVHAVAQELPDPASLPPGTAVFVLAEAAASGGFFGALGAFGGRKLDRATRSGALLARGYVDLGAEVDAASQLDVVFGRAPG
jgi:hypothetical protein